MANETFFVTAYGEPNNHRELNPPQVKALPANSIVEVIPTDIGSVIKTSLGGMYGLKQFKVLEKPAEVEAARNPSSADLRVKAKIALALTAAGDAQANALLIANYLNECDTVASGTGVRLPAAVRGGVHVIRNNGANALLVYPATGEKFSDLAANAAKTVAVGATITVGCLANGVWTVATE